jgi:PAS domain S-box-containing protein/putative nucleotidyltransferase with HDIG domain
LAVEQNPASIVITDLKGNIEYVNQKFAQVSGYTRQEVIGRNPRVLKSGETSRKDYEKLWKTITRGEVWHGEFHNKKKNGDLYWEDARISPITNENGKITHFVALKEDITERKRAESESLEKSKELEALFSISSHLRTAQTAEEMVPLVLEQMAQVLNADANALILLSEDRKRFTYKLGDGLLAINTGLQFDVSDSISGHIMETLQPYVTLDFENDPRRARAINGHGVGAAALVPLQSEAEFIGVLLCARAKNSPVGPFTPAETRLLTAIGEMVGNALRRAKLYDDARERMQRVQVLRSIDAAINANMDLIVTLRMLINQLLSMLKVEAAAILLYNSSMNTLEHTVSHGFKYKDIQDARAKLGREPANTVILEHRLITIRDLKNVEDPSYREIAVKEGFASCHIVPMLAKGQICGILEVYSRSVLEPDQEDLIEFLKALSSQAAIAINNTQLFNNLEKSNLELSLAYDATIEGWSKALELKDRETEGHTLRVTAWTVELAKLVGIEERKIMHIRRGALLHDIGKMGTPDHILKKAGKLTDKEWVIMRQHTENAYNMLYPIAFLRPAIDIPYCHHEKWDGTGYPRNLKGEGIPYVARLFAVVDVWDAITSNRPYRKAWETDKALEYIKSESGRHFDPAIAGLFVNEIDRFIKR